MKLVKFKDGQFGIRFGNIFQGYNFIDFKTKDCRRPLESLTMTNCRTSKEEAKAMLDLFTDKGEPIG